MKQLERALHQLLFGREQTNVAGVSPRGQRIYRRQVRKSLMNGVRIALPITRRLLGDEHLDELLADWLEQAPPTTRFYWQLPVEFATWYVEQPEPPHPALPELIHWESIEVDVRHAPPEPEGTALSDESSPQSGIVLHPSARLCIYHHPVHRLERRADAWPQAARSPIFLVAFRKDERVHWRSLAPQLAQLLARASQGESTAEAFAFLEDLYGDVDRDELERELGRLREQGPICGFS